MNNYIKYTIKDRYIYIYIIVLSESLINTYNEVLIKLKSTSNNIKIQILF